jgi:hypothetical protein
VTPVTYNFVALLTLVVVAKHPRTLVQSSPKVYTPADGNDVSICLKVGITVVIVGGVAKTRMARMWGFPGIVAEASMPLTRESMIAPIAIGKGVMMTSVDDPNCR